MKAPLAALVFVLHFLLQGMDLPLPPVRIGSPPHYAPPIRIAPDPEEDDPRDTPPPLFYGEQIDTETDSIIYVIDISGSMNIDGRLARARAETTRSITGLSINFRFNVLVYSTTVRPLWRTTHEANAQRKAQAAAWLTIFNAHGYTATGPAVANALDDKSNLTIALLTDGFPNWGIVSTQIASSPNMPPAQRLAIMSAAHRRVIRQANTQGATIQVFGLDARGPCRTFCQAVAADSGGSYRDVH